MTVWMRRALHDLSQPLTALECVLYLGTMAAEDSAEERLETIREAYRQCDRLMVQVRTMQDRVVAEIGDG